MNNLITNKDISDHANIEDKKLNTIRSRNKVANSATSATSSNRANTIVLRDSDGASRLSSVILKGADYTHKNVIPLLLTDGYIYLTNKEYRDYALFRNIDLSDNLQLSLDIGQNNHRGNFSIRTIECNKPTTNISVRNNKIGINTDNPLEILDVSGNLRISGSIKTTFSQGVMHSNSSGQLYSGLIFTNDISNNAITSDKLASDLLFTGIPTCVTDPSNNMSIANVSFVKSQIAKFPIPLHVTSFPDFNNPINFDYSVIVFEVSVNIVLPFNREEGYKCTLINKSNNDIVIHSPRDLLFNAFYSPEGSNQIIFEKNRQLNLLHIHSASSKSWFLSYN